MATQDQDTRYKLLRRTVNASDDTDWVATQTLPTLTDTAVVDERAGWQSMLVEVCLRWIDTTPTPNEVDLTDRGVATLTFIKLMRYIPTATAMASTIGKPETIVVDSASVALNPAAFRPVVIDEVRQGDRWTVRLTGMTPSAGAELAEVYYRYLTAA